MKFSLLSFVLVFCSLSIRAQDGKATYSSKAINFSETKPLRELPIIAPVGKEHKARIIPNKFRRNKPVNFNAMPVGQDPAWQKDNGSKKGRAPIIDWDGLNYGEGQAIPPDPSGAVGPDHYVQMVNTSWKIFDKTDSLLYGPASLGSIWGGNVNDGDPIVLYDKFADRWFLSEFKQSNNALLVAVSTTPDPLGSYYTYEFPLGTYFPDYPKYSIWTDGYYMTANKQGEQCYVLERDSMIAGSATAQIVGFDIPDIETSGFFSALPAHAGSSLPELGTPNYLFYFQDDAWSNQVDTDHVKIWEIDVDWLNTTNSTISTAFELDVAAFDSEFASNWDDIEQPNGQHLDAIPGAFMYMAQYRKFGTYDAVVLNHTVDVDATNHAGIRWYELRKYGNEDWEVHQQGTYAPDEDSRWMGSIAMDYQGNIGLAYSVAGTSTYPSLRFTGRYSFDPLGEMTITEETIIDGTSSQSGTNRFGDYAQMTVDPDDDATFWFTGEYISNNWKTRIAAFKIANEYDHDLGVIDVVSPVNGVLTANEEVTVKVYNFGLFEQSGFDISYQLGPGTVFTETYSDTLWSGESLEFTFSQTVDMSVEGTNYTITSYTSLANDEYLINDTLVSQVMHVHQNDIGISAITEPVSSSTLGDSESITVTIENFGSEAQSNFPVSYSIDGGAVFTDTVFSILDSAGFMSHTFTETADFSTIGDYVITAYTGLASDADNTNDTLWTTVTKEVCTPVSNCNFGDRITRIVMGSIDNQTACSPDGYGDYTTMVTDMYQTGNNMVQVSGGFSNQRLTMWIDLDDNFQFDTTEMVLGNELFTVALTDIPFNLPPNANLGEHLVRFRSQYNTGVMDPCIAIQYGETEDYKVNILEGDTIGLTENETNFGIDIIEIEPGLFNLSLKDYNFNFMDLEIHNSVGQLIYERRENNPDKNYSTTIDISDQAKGYYLLRVANGLYSKIEKIVVR